jgi:hypothetical protein
VLVHDLRGFRHGVVRRARRGWLLHDVSDKHVFLGRNGAGCRKTGRNLRRNRLVQTLCPDTSISQGDL